MPYEINSSTLFRRLTVYVEYLLACLRPVALEAKAGN
jgi:hypothetical protein